VTEADEVDVRVGVRIEDGLLPIGVLEQVAVLEGSIMLGSVALAKASKRGVDRTDPLATLKLARLHEDDHAHVELREEAWVLEAVKQRPCANVASVHREPRHVDHEQNWPESTPQGGGAAIRRWAAEEARVVRRPPWL